MLYYGTSRAICMLELLVQQSPSASEIIWRLVEIEVPDPHIAHVDITSLPSDWANIPAPASTKSFGQRWVERKSSLGLAVPSVIIPRELNVIMNPAHEAIGEAAHIATTEFRFDPRLR